MAGVRNPAHKAVLQCCFAPISQHHTAEFAGGSPDLSARPQGKGRKDHGPQKTQEGVPPQIYSPQQEEAAHPDQYVEGQ